MARFSPPGFGWSCSIPAFEDFTCQSEIVQQALLGLPASTQALPDEVDLRDFFPDVDLQMPEVSSSIHACCALVEYFERRADGCISQPAALFVHHAVATILQQNHVHECDIRTVLSAIARFGYPQEKYFPYECKGLLKKPDAGLYAYAKPLTDLLPFRIDRRNQPGTVTLETVKQFLAAGFPIVFGFPAPQSISNQSDIPYRPQYDALEGGLAVLAVGYDDRHLRASKGALLIRNAWGENWGEQGYGWLPYAFLTEQWACDCWCVIRKSWLDSGEFNRPGIPVLK